MLLVREEEEWTDVLQDVAGSFIEIMVSLDRFDIKRLVVTLQLLPRFKQEADDDEPTSYPACIFSLFFLHFLFDTMIGPLFRFLIQAYAKFRALKLNGRCESVSLKWRRFLNERIKWRIIDTWQEYVIDTKITDWADDGVYCFFLQVYF